MRRGGKARLANTRWFELLQKRSRAVAKRLGLSYPGATVKEAAKIHARAEAELGAVLERMVSR